MSYEDEADSLTRASWVGGGWLRRVLPFRGGENVW